MDTKLWRSSRGGPVRPESGYLGDLLELAADLPAVEWGAVLAAEHQVVIMPRVGRLLAMGSLAGVVGAQRVDGLGREFQHAPALAGLGVGLLR